MRPSPICESDLGTLVDDVLIRSLPDPGCYGCRGTGRLWWAGVAPVPCTCVTHGPDCEPESCDCAEARDRYEERSAYARLHAWGERVGLGILGMVRR